MLCSPAAPSDSKSILLIYLELPLLCVKEKYERS